MLSLVKYVLLVPFWVLSVQFYSHAVSQQGEQKQRECRSLGIIFTAIGIVSLVFRDVFFAVSGLVLIMLGLRLMAHGLDRIDKKRFIDQYENR
jgi:hypothetical protein